MSKLERNISAAPTAIHTAIHDDGVPRDPLALSAEELAKLDRKVQQAHAEARRKEEADARLESLREFGHEGLTNHAFGRPLRLKIQLPGEGSSSFAVHHAALMMAFRPKHSVEVTLLEGFIRLDWEMVRHRVMRENAIFDAAREKIRTWVVARMAHGETASARASGPKTDAGVAPTYWSQFTSPDNAVVEEEVDRVLDIVFDHDPEESSEAYEALLAAGLDPLGILAETLEAAAKGGRIAFHDKAIEALEDRRRRAMDDFIRIRRATESMV